MKKKDYIQPQATVLILNTASAILTGSVTVTLFDKDVDVVDGIQYAPGIPGLGDMTGLGEIGNLIQK